MNSRYLTNLTLGIAGGFLIVASQVWSVSVFMWIMVGIGALAIALAGAAFAPNRGNAQRGIDTVTGLLGAWTIIAGLVFSGAAVTWLGFASGAAFLVLGLVGLTLHELKTERVVHSFEVRNSATEPAYTGEREYAAIN